jgi:O-antigen ligase
MTPPLSLDLQSSPSNAINARAHASARRFLTLSLFFIFAGNIPLTASGDESSATAIVRACGLACGIGCLLVAMSRDANPRVGVLFTWLSPFLIFMAYCVFTAAWSLQPSATLIRSAETTTTIGFTALWTHVAFRHSRSERDPCTWIALAVLGVAIYGLLVNTALFGGPIRIVVSEESERARFVFGGLHPLAVGDILAIGSIATVISRPRLIAKLLILSVLLPLLYLANATGATMLVLAITMAYIATRTAKWLGAGRVVILLPFAVVTAGFALATAFSLELPPIQRIAEDDRLWTLTGRTQLWGAIWEAGLASTWFGTGFDAARNAILAIFGVAYQVHNQYLAILVELGYVGLALSIPLLVIWLVPIIKSRSLMVGCFVLYILGINLDNASMFTKTWLIFLTVFCYVFALEILSRSRRRLEPPLRSQPMPMYVVDRRPQPRAQAKSNASYGPGPRRRPARQTPSRSYR